MSTALLETTVQHLLSHGKGILAIDESESTCRKRFEALGVPCTEETRRAYRELLITAPDIEQYVSGMILFDETLRQSTADGRTFVNALLDKGILPGIKVDLGTQNLGLHPNEKITFGLDDLHTRLQDYQKMGAQFSKWRAVITIGPDLPSRACIKANAHALARYAALSQEAGLVPMVEPEVLIDGDHSIERCLEVTQQTLSSLFSELKEQGVHLPGAILKTSMVLSGKLAASQAGIDQVAEQTVACLLHNVPADLGGVVFLSGGQDDEKATLHLNRMHQLHANLPWPLSFSYGRSIQNPALTIWAKDMQAVVEAQAALLERARANGLAAQGKYEG